MIKSYSNSPILPSSPDFKNWLAMAIDKLNLKQSDLMKDDTPGAKNRVQAILGRSHSVKLDTAKALVDEIMAIAEEQGKIIPSPFFADCSENRKSGQADMVCHD